LAHSFYIKFITPLLIGGAEDNRYGDDIELTGKALRGCWRFWFRALVGGCLKDLNPGTIADLENKVFGSTESSSFRLLVEEVSNTIGRIGKQPRLPHKSGKEAAPFYCAIAPGSTIRITIVPRQSLGAERYTLLLLTIWTWAYLGAVGNRARRGFGSPVLCESKNGDDAFNHLIKMKKAGSQLPSIKESFTNESDLTAYLENGLPTIWKRFSAIVASQGYEVKGDIERVTRPKYAPFFILSSLSQISVGSHFQHSTG
jgi:CRISPR type III-B/RAMP module RAMP protein Cmr1